jgi:hypothetical protein
LKVDVEGTSWVDQVSSCLTVSADLRDMLILMLLHPCMHRPTTQRTKLGVWLAHCMLTVFTAGAMDPYSYAASWRTNVQLWA